MEETLKLLQRWLALYNTQQTCYFCEIIPHQCHVHPKHSDALKQLAVETEELLNP